MTLLDYRTDVRNLIAHFLPQCLKAFPCSRNPQEPDYTASLAIGLPKLLDADITTKNLGLRFGGCYIHQKPYVSYEDGTTAKTCELGDLLVLCREKKSGKELINAALFQLKMVKGECGVDERQLRLYAEWPKLWFGRSKQSDGKCVYDVYPKAETQGALYSFVHRANPSSTSSGLRFTVATPHQCSADKYVDGKEGMPLQDFLADFIIGLTGRLISSEKAEKASGDDWSALIRETVAQIKESVIRRSGLLVDQSQMRAQGDLFLNLMGTGGLAEDAATSEEEASLTGGMGVLVISKSDEIDASVYERLTKEEVEKRLEDLGYEHGDTALEYKVHTKAGRFHTVWLKKLKENYTREEVKKLLNKMGDFVNAFWSGDLPKSKWFIGMDLVGCGKNEECDDRSDASFHAQNDEAEK